MSFWECEKCGGVPGVTPCCSDNRVVENKEDKMSKRISAEEARNMTLQNADYSKAVDEIMVGITAKALAGESVFITRGYGFGDGCCYCNEDKWPKLNREIVRELRKLGYVAKVKSEAKQFVDLWLEVSW